MDGQAPRFSDTKIWPSAFMGSTGILAIALQAEATVLYIIISGFGVLRCANGARLEFTEGDLIMVPSGASHRFEEVSPKFKTWRIVLGSTADGAG